MKRILILFAILFLAIYMAQGHCYKHPCVSYTSVSGSVSTSYIGSKCFQTSGSGTTVFTTACNFNGWKYLYFTSKVDIKCPINMNSISSNLYFYGSSKIDYVSMDGGDTIKNDGSLEITELISNNSYIGQENVIYTDNRVKIRGIYYYPGDTFFTYSKSMLTNKVLITDCKGVSLPINIIKYSGRIIPEGVEVMWEVNNIEPVTLHYSIDGRSWINLYNVKSPFLIKEKASELFVKISVENDYSETLIFKRDYEEESYEVYDLVGNRLTIEPIETIYFKKYIPSGRREKNMIIK